MNNNHWSKSPWTIGIVTAFLGVIFTLFFTKDFFVNIISAIKWGVLFCYNFTIEVLSFNFKIWWILILVIAYVIYKRIKKTYTPSKKEVFDFKSYKRDILKKWNWTWEWEFDITTRKYNLQFNSFVSRL
jgi:hypothetical protein